MKRLLAILVLLVGCGTSEAPVVDVSADAVSTEAAASELASSEAPASRRIVTLGGSVTETVCALGRCGDLVGRDMTSTFPAEVAELPDVGYFRKVSAEGILALEPELIIASAHAGPPTTLQQLRDAGVEVVQVPDEPGAEAALTKIDVVAEALGVHGAELRAGVETAVAEAKARVPDGASPKVLVLYARGPGNAYVMGRGTAGHQMLEMAGGTNALDMDGSAPVSAEAIVAAQPEVVLIPEGALQSVGGVDGLFAMPGLGAIPAAEDKRVVALDDLALMGFGPRLGETLDALVTALHGEPSAGQ